MRITQGPGDYLSINEPKHPLAGMPPVKRIKAYGAISAAILNFLMKIGRILSGGTCFHDPLVRIPGLDKSHFIFLSHLKVLKYEADDLTNEINGVALDVLKIQKKAPPEETFEGATFTDAFLENLKERGIFITFNSAKDREIVFFKDLFKDVPPGHYFLVENASVRFLGNSAQELIKFYQENEKPPVIHVLLFHTGYALPGHTYDTHTSLKALKRSAAGSSSLPFEQSPQNSILVKTHAFLHPMKNNPVSADHVEQNRETLKIMADRVSSGT